jgi:hypothetical protein
MGQKIICSETTCDHLQGGHTAHDYTYEYVCANPDGVVISARKGCQSSTCTVNVPLKPKEIDEKDINYHPDASFGMGY